jgi:hypothetical protein
MPHTLLAVCIDYHRHFLCAERIFCSSGLRDSYSAASDINNQRTNFVEHVDETDLDGQVFCVLVGLLPNHSGGRHVRVFWKPLHRGIEGLAERQKLQEV